MHSAFRWKATALFLTFCITNFARAAEQLSLESAMDLAEKHSPQARIAQASRDEAESRRLQAMGSLGPRLDADASRMWFDKDTNKLVGLSPQLPERTTTAGATISQPIISLAPMLMRVNAQAKLLEVAKNQEKLAASAARLEGANAFLGIVQSEQLLDVANASFAAVAKQHTDAQAQAHVGRLSPADAMRFELALTEAKLQQTLAQNTLLNAKRYALETLGVEESTLVVSASKQSIWELRNPSIPNVEDSVKTALAGRLEIQTAREQTETAELARTAARYDFFPTLNAFAKYQRDFEAKDKRFPGTGANDPVFAKKDIQDTMTYGLQLSWNIWDWGTKYNRISEYSAGVIKARAGEEATRSQVTIEATRATLDLRSAIESLASAKAASKLAEEVFRLTDIRFRGGQVSTSDVIQAERDVTRARGNVVTARGNVDLSWLKYQKAMGFKPTTNQQ